MKKEHRGAAIGFVTGALVALIFALVISLIPSQFITEPGSRAICYLVCAAAAPPTILFTSWIAKLTGGDRQKVFIWTMGGAMTFDGIMSGFVPAVYGHSGAALAGAASALLFAFASNMIAAALMLRSNTTEKVTD